MENNVVSKWASLGILVDGEIHSLQDPEELMIESILNLEKEERLLSILVTWISRYGHLLITKKIKFPTPEIESLFYAITESSHHSSIKLKSKKNETPKEPVFLFSSLTETQKKWALKDPHPVFLKYGWILKNHELIRPKILCNTLEVFTRSKILQHRAMYGSTLRSDLLVVLQKLKNPVGVRELARKLHVSHPAVLSVLKELKLSKLIEQNELKIHWLGLKKLA